MPTSLLLLSTDTRWIGPVRAPKALVEAGFDVHLLAPRGTMIDKSRFVSKIGYLPERADAAQWVFALAAMVKAVSPRLLMPCDDMSYQLMYTLFHAPPPGMQPGLHASLAALIRESLGDPGYYQGSVDKLQLPMLAEGLGVPVARYRLVASAAEARAFAAETGYPVVLKRSHSTGGTGVWICDDPRMVDDVFAQARPPQGSAAGAAGPMLVQAGIDGHRTFYPVAAWQGKVLAGYASDALMTHPAPKGPATVVKGRRDAQMREAVERIVAGFGISGILGFEFMTETATGRRYLLEINRRMVPGLHRGSRMRLDLFAALQAAIEGRPSPTRDDLDEGEESMNVHFPQEWLRDPQSAWLRNHPVDVPWDEPELIEALLALRHRD